MDEKLRSGKRYFFFTTIAGCFLLGYILFLTFRFEDAILYLGEKAVSVVGKSFHLVQ